MANTILVALHMTKKAQLYKHMRIEFRICERKKYSRQWKFSSNEPRNAFEALQNLVWNIRICKDIVLSISQFIDRFQTMPNCILELLVSHGSSKAFP